MMNLVSLAFLVVFTVEFIFSGVVSEGRSGPGKIILSKLNAINFIFSFLSLPVPKEMLNCDP